MGILEEKIRSYVIQTRWNGLHGEKDERSEAKVVRTCEKRCNKTLIRRYNSWAITNFKRDRGKPKKIERVI